jgi:regulatory protein
MSSEANRIYDYCIFLLSRQDYSEFKLRQKLRMKQHLPHEIDEVVEKIKGQGYLREESYRRLFIRKWMLKGESKEKIIQRGAQEKLQFEQDEFQRVAQELGTTDQDSLQRLLEKKLRGKAIPQDFMEKRKLQDKVLRYLISKGHSFEAAKRSLQEIFNP